MLKRQLKEAFDMKDMGKLQYFLGIQVHCNRKNRGLQIPTRTLFSNDSTWRTHLQSLRPWRPAQSSANRQTNLRPQTENSINRMLAAKCTTCCAPDLISHTQSRKSRNSLPIHRPFTKRRQKDLFDISTGLAISESHTTEAKD